MHYTFYTSISIIQSYSSTKNYTILCYWMYKYLTSNLWVVSQYMHLIKQHFSYSCDYWVDVMYVHLDDPPIDHTFYTWNQHFKTIYTIK